VTFGHHLLAYVEMLGRDRGRFADARKRLNESRSAPPRSPAPPSRSTAHDGEGAGLRPADGQLAGQRRTATSRSSSCRPQRSAPVHLSRLAEEIVIWMTPQFGFVRFSDKFTTGSSIMPQKRNPDAAELVRAKSGRIIGSLTSAAGRHEGPAAAYSRTCRRTRSRCSTPSTPWSWASRR
jgi:argininosuccinate lyase